MSGADTQPGGSLTVGDVVVAALRRFPDRVAFQQDDQSWTYRQAEDALARWVAVLKQRGLRRGEGVGLLSPNRPEAWLTATSAILAGGRYTALHPLGSLDDHLYACNEGELRYVFVDPVFAERAVQIKEQAATVEAVFSFGPSEAGEDFTTLAAEVPLNGRLEAGDRMPDDLAYLLYTGGTTGVPKAVMQNDRAVVAHYYGTALGWDLPKTMRYLAVAPISHAAGMLILPTLLSGGTVVLQRRFEPAAWLRAIASERANLSLLVPTMIYALLDRPDLDNADLSSLETVMYGASPISPTRLREAIERIGPVFCQLWGMTESAGQGTSLWRDQHDVSDLHRLTSCGTAMPFNRVAVLDEDGGPVADGEPGELCIQGPTVMAGYWRQPELTQQALKGGRLHTGDIGVRDSDGFFYIVDRKKDMIVSGGFNVFPREVEDVIASHPAVSSVAVIGVPDEKWGEAVKALVVLRPGAACEGAELIELVRGRKGPVYAPKTVDFIDSLPMTAVGKADKKVLRARYWEREGRQVG